MFLAVLSNSDRFMLTFCVYFLCFSYQEREKEKLKARELYEGSDSQSTNCAMARI